MPKTCEDGLPRQRRDPQTFDRLAAARQGVDEIEDQLALTPGGGRVDNRGHIGTSQELFDDVVLVAGRLGGVIGERGWADRQIRHAPLLPHRIVRLWLVEFDQVADAPRNNVAAPLQVAWVACGDTEGCRHRAPHRRLLRDDDPLAVCAASAGALAPGGADVLRLTMW